jgi:membrane fusion protein, multidrug efflux system
MIKKLVLWILILAAVGSGYFYRDMWLPKVMRYVAFVYPPANSTANPEPSKKSGGGKRGAGPITVLVAKAEEGTLPITRQTIGTIAPVASSALTTSIAGIVAEINVKDGADVKKGDLVAQLDARVIRATIIKDQATMAKDQVTLDNLKATMQRTVQLAAKGVVAKQTGDDATAAMNVAAQALKFDQAALDADAVNLSLTEIRAPFDGRIGTVALSPGAYAAAGTAIATVTQVNPVFAQFSLPEGDAVAIREAFDAKTLTVTVMLIGKDGKKQDAAEGPVVFVDNAIDPASGTLKMRAQLGNENVALLVGQSISVKVDLGQTEKMILVPNVAVTPSANGNAVYVVKDDNTIEVRPVEIGLRGEIAAGITKGLSVGEQVVIEGQINLVNGSPITIGKANADATLKNKKDKTKQEAAQ